MPTKLETSPTVSKNSRHIGAKKHVWMLSPVYSCVIWNSAIIFVFFNPKNSGDTASRGWKSIGPFLI